uniref:Osteocrin n=1 Tax=Sphaeramia orbicularis TaxID=375764 RepID=A0A672YEG6_9TELE
MEFTLNPKNVATENRTLQSSVIVFQRVDQSMSRTRTVGVKAGEELTAKLLRLDHLVRMENDVMEPKRKRSFPSNSAPLDRLSVSSMETKQGSNKQRKTTPKQEVSTPMLHSRSGVLGMTLSILLLPNTMS